MKRLLIFVLIIGFTISGFGAYAAENKLLKIRNDIFEEAGKVKDMLTSTKDMIFLNSLYDSCLLTVTQIDAYFSMLGIFNTIERDIDKAAVGNILRWLDVTKRTNASNIKSIAELSQVIDEETQAHVKIVSEYFKKLAELLDIEISRFTAIMKSIR